MHNDLAGWGDLAVSLKFLKVLDSLSRGLDLRDSHQINAVWKQKKVTLMASVRTAAITSKERPRMRLVSSDGSYSQMAVAVSMAAILVMCPMTVMFPMLTTCSKQLKQNVSRQEIRNEKLTVIASHRHPIAVLFEAAGIRPFRHSSCCCLRHRK